jgi:O-antigen ligase
MSPDDPIFAPEHDAPERRRRRASSSSWGPRSFLSPQGLATVIFALLILTLPLMMGNRTPMTLTATALWLVIGAIIAWASTLWTPSGNHAVPSMTAAWWGVIAALSAVTLLQILPIEPLARAFGPYPDALWSHPSYEPSTWSPNPGAAARGWAVFMALAMLAWIAGQLAPRFRGTLWLVISLMALFQALYGLVSHASGSTHILGIWERHTTEFVHGTYSNRNLFAGYLSLTWPLVVAVWWIRDVPLLRRLPTELKVAGSVISGAIVGAALMGSASRLGAMAGLIGMTAALILWTRYRGVLKDGVIWPVWLAAFAAFLFATWYGLAPITDRLAMTSSADSLRFEVWAAMLQGIELKHWLAGVGFGGFEAVFKTVQPGHINGWWDYAHNDLLQWLLELGLIGALVLLLVLGALVRNAALTTERIPLYTGLIALAVVGLGDFSWHMPGTQVVLALYLGVLMQPGPRRRSPSPVPEKRRVRRRRRRKENHG